LQYRRKLIRSRFVDFQETHHFDLSLCGMPWHWPVGTAVVDHRCGAGTAQCRSSL
jgi:hypothetical protein